MEQLISTPVRPAEIIIGKIIPYFVIGMFDVLIAVVTAVLVFDVPLRGSEPLLGPFLMSTLGIGLFISTVCGTQQQAMMTTFFFFFPAMLLSGFIYPIANMPAAVQWVTMVNPLRHVLVIIRGIFSREWGRTSCGRKCSRYS